MANINVLVDTNVLIRASLQEDVRIELLKMLEFAKKRLIKFTMLEIVLDEFEKHNNKLEETLNQEIAKVSKGIRKEISNCKLWNELNDLSDYVIMHCISIKVKNIIKQHLLLTKYINL